MIDVLKDAGIAIGDDNFIGFSLVMLYLLMYKKIWVKDQFKNRSTGVFTKKEILYLVLFNFTCQILVRSISFFSGKLPGMLEAYENRFSDISIYSYIHAIIYAPILEEFFVRGYILGKLRKIHGKKVAIIISALIFGLIHGNYIQFWVTSILGIMMAITVIRTGNLRMGIMIHFINNLMASFVHIEVNLKSFSYIGTCVTYQFIMMIIFYFVLNFMNNRNKKALEEGEMLENLVTTEELA